MTHQLRPDHQPTPFTADEIRAASPAGKTITLRVETAGEPAYTMVSRIVAADADGADREYCRIADDGTPGPVRASRSTWLELQSHASFAAAAAVVETDLLDTPLGRLDCLRYTVTHGAEVDTFWFARELPGMPVRIVRTRDGLVTETVTMVANAGAERGRPG